MRNSICILLIWVLMESATSFGSEPSSSSSICRLDHKTFLHDLNSQCPFVDPFSSPIQVDGESFERAISSHQKNGYTAVLFYASWCPFSRIFQSKFSTLSSMFPQIKHVQTSVVPSVFSRYGVHSVPSLLILNQTARMRYNGRKDLQSLISFYKRTTGMEPVVDMVEETSIKETSTREPYLILSALFVLLRVLLYMYPGIASRSSALWAAYIPRLNLGKFRESGNLLGNVLHLIDIKRIWSKPKISNTRKFRKTARKARAWAFTSVSLGETSSSPSCALVVN